ncbi:MAG: omptin family outer membrane protease [Candidatus Omnitrophica bacterium]|nr:omptin family outer membrane protease [Candidatus Omnitrophota bacterium]
MQRYMVSHTSYEIGNPDGPRQEPLSRLEFPLDTWWLRFDLRRTSPRWSVGGRAGLSVARNVDGRMKDSDWERESTPEMLTTYSESACRAEANYLFRGDVDVNVADWLGLPSSVEIRPLFAFQFQRFNLMAHDGVQWSNGLYGEDDDVELDGAQSSVALAGDGIHFRQDYYLYQIGARGAYNMQAARNVVVRVHGEADWGPALAYYEDHHLLREGDLFSYCKGRGNSLYFLAGLETVIAKTITVGIDMDYTWIGTTRATITHSNIPLHENQSWDNGVKIWSDQTSLVAHVSYAF